MRRRQVAEVTPNTPFSIFGLSHTGVATFCWHDTHWLFCINLLPQTNFLPSLFTFLIQVWAFYQAPTKWTFNSHNLTVTLTFIVVIRTMKYILMRTWWESVHVKACDAAVMALCVSRPLIYGTEVRSSPVAGLLTYERSFPTIPNTPHGLCKQSVPLSTSHLAVSCLTGFIRLFNFIVLGKSTPRIQIDIADENGIKKLRWVANSHTHDPTML